MGNVADKLGKLAQTKADIRAAIMEQGQTVEETEPFAAYPEKIRAIEAVGNWGSEPLDPVAVYRATRPSDWMDMPEPQDNELYLLFHIPEGASALLAFTTECTEDYRVEFGAVEAGVFQPCREESLPSGTKFEAELFAEDYGALTADGFKQVMIRVSGATLLSWKSSPHSKRTTPQNFCGWNIVEMAGKLPEGKRISPGNLNEAFALTALRYFAVSTKADGLAVANRFANCRGLVAVLTEDLGTVSIIGAYLNCTSLMAVPQIQACANIGRVFENCTALRWAPAVVGRNPYNELPIKNIGNMFCGCTGIRLAPEMPDAELTSIKNAFAGCTALVKIPLLRVWSNAGTSSCEGAFTGCTSLASVKFDPAVTGWAGADISFENCALEHKALVELFESLPTITAAHTLTLTGNPGVGELTQEEGAIATNKGWTLILKEELSA